LAADHQDKLRTQKQGAANKILHGHLLAAGNDESKVDWGGLRKDLADYKEYVPASLGILFEEDPQVMAQKVEEQLAGTTELVRQMKTGDFDRKKAVPAANSAFSYELDARGRKNGAKQLRITDILPSPQGDGYVFDSETTRADDTTYRAPLTENGGTAEQGDNKVKIFPAAQTADYLVSQFKSLKGLQSHLQEQAVVQAADQRRTPLQAYLQAQGVIEPKEDKWSFGGSGEVKMNERTGEVGKTGYAKPKDAGYKTYTDANGRVWAYDPKNPKDKQLLSDATKPDGNGGKNGKGGKGGKEESLPDHILELFKTPSRYDENGYKVGDEGIDTQRLSDFVVFKSSYGRDMTYEDAAAQFLKSQRRGVEQQGPADPDQGVTQDAIDQVPPQRLSALQQGLKNAEAAGKEEAIGYLEELSRTSPIEYAVLARTLGENAGKPDPAPKPQRRGMVEYLKSDEVQEKGLIPLAVQGMASHVEEAQKDPRFPGWR
jgi:hypothetical protein